MAYRKFIQPALFMLTCLAMAISATGQQQGPFNYIVVENQAIITGLDPAYSGEVVIPETLGGYPVVGIGNSAFANRYGVTSVMMPNTVVWIGNYAFHSCLNITNFSLPNSLKTVGRGAFEGTGIQQVRIPSSVTNLGANAFFGCWNLQNVTLEDGLIGIGDMAFAWCRMLQTITLPDSVMTVGEQAFGFSGLTNVSIGKGLTSLGQGAFVGCPNLLAVNVAAGNANYYSSEGVLFSRNPVVLLQYPVGRAGAYAVPVGVTGIGPTAFSGAYQLTSIHLPFGLTGIGESAFCECTNLTSLLIPDTVTWLGERAFEWCFGLTNVVIGNGVTNIGSRAFLSCIGLKRVVVGKNVTTIGDYAFVYCTTLERVYFLGNAPTTVGQQIFSSADGVTVYYLPNKSGWGPTFAERPTRLWNPLFTGIRPEGPEIRLRISGTPNIPIALEVSTNIACAHWLHQVTTNLAAGQIELLTKLPTGAQAAFWRIVGP
ncbi:MAG: leucine-rich repeat domain-containing protein [Verrucomicrobiae bacterium]|nr:leucine-rich repeat domain-containing protein [Verrucomicrobiae bacterium]